MSKQKPQTTPQPERSADLVRRVERRAQWGNWAASRPREKRWNGVDRGGAA